MLFVVSVRNIIPNDTPYTVYIYTTFVIVLVDAFISLKHREIQHKIAIAFATFITIVHVLFLQFGVVFWSFQSSYVVVMSLSYLVLREDHLSTLKKIITTQSRDV